MKNKINKFFVAFLSCFLILGGSIFAACGNDDKQANISVSSQDFVSEDYIEIDLGSDKLSADITASVSGVSSGRVSVNNDFQSIVSASATYNEKSNNTQIHIVGKNEGEAELVLRSYEGGAQKIIKVFVYSNILGLSQKEDKAQYVVRGEQTILDSDRFLSFQSRPNGESNRKAVTWSISENQDGLILDGKTNTLTVGENVSSPIKLIATSVYTSYFAEVELNVISPIEYISVEASSVRDPNIFDIEIGEDGKSFNIVKNDDSSQESEAYIKVSLPTDEEIEIEPIVLLDGEEAKDRLDISQHNKIVSGGITSVIYKIAASGKAIKPESLQVNFEARYVDYDYSIASNSFTINLVDVIRNVSLSSNGKDLPKGERVNIYDVYASGSANQFGHPIVASFGPDTVANDQAKYYIELNIDPRGVVKFFDARGNQIEFSKNGNVWRSALIENYAQIYVRAASNADLEGATFENGQTLSCTFASEQSPSVNAEISLICNKAPSADFELQGEREYFLATDSLHSVLVEVTAPALKDIPGGISPIIIKENQNFELTNFVFDNKTGKITFTVSNTVLNLSGEGEKLDVIIAHENGFRSSSSLSVEAFIPLKNAAVKVDGQSVSAVPATYVSQSYGNASFANSSLESLIMKFGTSAKLTLNNSAATSTTFKFVEDNGATADSENWPSDIASTLVAGRESLLAQVTSGGLLKLSSQSFKGYILATFVGRDENHNEITAYRIFYLESYVSPQRLMPNKQSLTLTALDSISAADTKLARDSVSVSFRLDGEAISYADPSNIVIYSNADKAKISLINRKDYKYYVENVIVNKTNISFDVVANSTEGFDRLLDQIVVEYGVFGQTYPVSINLLIQNARRVEKLVWENAPVDKTIYIDMFGESEIDRNFPIISSILPASAYNKNLRYIFVPNSGTLPDAIKINQELGVVTFGSNAGGTGNIYTLPEDAIRNIGGEEQISFYKKGATEPTLVKLSDIASKFSEIIEGHFFRFDDNLNREEISYSDFMLKIAVVVADGRSEATAKRIYSAEQLKSIDPQMHYILMNSLSVKLESSLGNLTGSFKGASEDVTIVLESGSKSLFDSVLAGAKVQNLTLAGSVSGQGFVASSNAGLIENVGVTVYSAGGNIVPGTISGEQSVGAIVGTNSGEIRNVRVEGASVLSTGYAGGVAGTNSGSIYGAKVEFYKFESGVNSIKGTEVGGIVGLLDGGAVERSYAYNYVMAEGSPLVGTKLDALLGAFAGKVQGSGASITYSFSLLAEDKQKEGEAEGVKEAALKPVGDGSATLSDVYFSFTETDDTVSNSSNWERTLSYVRGGKRYLKDFHQDESLTSLDDFVISSTDSWLKVGENGNSGLFFLHKLDETSTLSSSEQSALDALNTFNLSDIFNEKAKNVVALSDNTSVVEVVGNSLVVRSTGEAKITLSSKQDFSLNKTINVKVIYVLNNFEVIYDGLSTGGFDIQEGKTESVDFAVKNSIYLAGGARSHKLMLNGMSVKTAVSDNAKGYASFDANGMQANLTAKKGIVNEIGKDNSFNITAHVEIGSLNDSENAAIKDYTQRTLTIRPFVGSNEILVNSENITIETAYSTNLTVTLLTDSSSDSLELNVLDGEIALDKKVAENMHVFSIAGEDVIEIVVTNKGHSNGKTEFVLNVSVSDGYKSKISGVKELTLKIGSKTATAVNEGREVGITLKRQDINNIDITNYKSGTSSVSGGVQYYSHTSEAVSVISPGRSSIMEITLDPKFAYYEYMTLTYTNTDGASLGLTSLNKVGNRFTANSHVQEVPGGIKVERNESGYFAFRLYAANNISSDTTFDIVASFMDASGNPIKTAKYQLFISYLPVAEITIDGEIEAKLAKGGSLDMQILLQQDQDVDSLVAAGVSGITFTSKDNWQITNNPNGTKLITIRAYAELDAGLTGGANGTFEVVATVSRNFNGVLETKSSRAYVTIVDFLPVSANLVNGEYRESVGALTMNAYIGISRKIDFNYTFDPERYNYDLSNSEQKGFADKLNENKQKFREDGNYYDAETGFAINYDFSESENGKPVPIYERLFEGNNKLDFKKSEETGAWSYSNSRFRLTYKDGNLSVIGLSSSASPTVLTLKDTIIVKANGKNISQTIESKFAIDTVVHSDPDLPLLIESEEDFKKVAEEGQAQDYILLNDITLKNYTPISAAMFRTLDGNGHTIHIESFAQNGSGSLSMALFTDIPSSSLIKNLKINYYNGGNIRVDTTNTGFNNIRVAGVAITNSGTITNTEVVAYRNEGATAESGATGIRLRLMRGETPYYIDANSSVTAEVAGFVLDNSGTITNSRVGGKEIVIIGSQQGDTDTVNFRMQELGMFTLSGQGNMAGFVLTNSGVISASGASQMDIENLSTSNALRTSGFVGSNSGKVRASFVEGMENKSADTQYHIDGSSIRARGIVAGFVSHNNTSGEITDGYSNIFISSDKTSKSRTSAGFVYENEGYIAKSFAASYVELANAQQLAFSGVASDMTSLNKGKIELSYYYLQDVSDDVSGDVQNTVQNGASLINRDEVENENAYYGFIFAENDALSDGVWKMEKKGGVKLVSRDIFTVSHRYYVGRDNGEYVLPYATLQNENNKEMTYNTGLGREVNPILIASAKDFKEAVGESESIYVKQFYTSSQVTGNYRFVCDIDLSELNNAAGNAQITSTAKTLTGKIDGNGFAIKNISLRSDAEDNKALGLFAEINGGFVQNLALEVNNVTASTTLHVGTLAGIVRNSKLSNIALSQIQKNDNSSDVRGVLGGNMVGAVAGSVLGDTRIYGITAKDAIVQASSRGHDVDYTGEDDKQENNFAPNEVRANPYFDVVKNYSFAGGIFGYLDTYLSNEAADTNFRGYAPKTSADYTVKKLLSFGSISVRGEVVGGVVGYTGINTLIQDIGIQIAKGENTYANILSYDAYAGGVVGLANGQFHQIYAEHEANVQKDIEEQTKEYYKSSGQAERGITNLFEFNGIETGDRKYEPESVGGLFGVVRTGAITVGYSKLNAVNPNKNGGYAGGIAGRFVANGQYSVAIGTTGTAALMSLYMNEVYASGDVYATRVGDNGAFGGLFGDISSSQLALVSVNAVNHYALREEGRAYYDLENPTVYAIAGKGATNDNVKVYASAISKDGAASDETNFKSFGYMADYAAAGNKTLTIKPFNGFEEYKEEDGKPTSATINANFYFKMTAVSEFEGASDGWTETNGAFINSKAWDGRNWNHPATQLYPSINFINSVNYIYLDQDNIESVIARMQNSSIEVRVRGQKRDGQNISYGDVDLSSYLKDGGTIQGYSGKIVGGYAGCGWGEGFEENKDDRHGFPGLIIDRTLFASVNSGFSMQTLNVEIKTVEKNGKVKSIDGGYIVGKQVTSAQFDGVNIYVPHKLEISAVDGDAGVLVPSAVNSSFRNISFNFENPDVTDQYIKTTKATTGANTALNNAGLIAGQIEQSSIYDAVKVQNISIKCAAITGDRTILHAYGVSDDVESDDVNVGLYVGKISGKGGAGLVADIKASEKLSDAEEFGNSIIRVSGSANNLNFGGYFGELSVSTTSQVSFNKTQNYTQKLILQTNCKVTESANIGGIVGNANITRFSTSVSAQSGDKTLLNTDLEFSQNVKNLNAGLMFGKTETGNTISIANTGDGVKGSIFISKNDKVTANFTGNTNIGGLIGENNGNVTISDLTLSFEAYKGTENKSNKKINMTGDFSPISTQMLNFGGFIGKNDGDLTIKKTAEKEIAYNQNGENVAFTSTGDINAGDIVGLISGGGNVFINDFNSEAINYFETTSTLNVGGLVGQVNKNDEETKSANIQIVNESETVKDIISNSNNFINAVKVNAGGIVGNINIADASSFKVEGTVFGGAFKFFGTKNNAGTHLVGGILGKATASSTCSVSNNITYGDAIYSYKDADFNLNNYYFGGVIGNVEDTASNRASNLLLGGNVVAFTNNNPRLASAQHSADAMVGNGQQVEFPDTNFYCSQLVLAVSDSATDLGYNAKAKGYGESPAEATILGKIGLRDAAEGSKLNPISNGKAPSGEGAENSNSNGIVYYAGAQPEKQGDKFAFIGNFSASNGGTNYAPFTEVGKHSFVSGMVVSSNLEDSSADETRTNIGGVVDKLSGGIVYACSSNGSLSVGGEDKKNVGGIVGLMNGGLIAESYSSVNIVYRAAGVDATSTAAEEATSTGTATAAGVAVTTGENNFFDATYSTGNVQSYISSNLYAFTNGEGATIRNSYTISWVSHKDHTKKAVASGATGVFGDAKKHSDNADVWYDKNAVELSNESRDAAITPISYGAQDNTAQVTSGWSKARDVNYGYPTRNFNVFQTSTVEEIEDKTYHLVPNATKLGQITGDDKNFKLTRDIDFDKSTEVSAKVVTGIFDGNNKTIRGVNATLFSSVGTLKNLRVEAIEGDGMNGSAVVADSVATAENVIATGVLNGSGEIVGGLFAKSTGDIENCKNYVKIEDANATIIGGVVGQAGGAVAKCVNYSPINSTKVGGVVGGVVGKLSGNISYCGNENTVFSGYTSGGNGNYTAGGVVGNMASGSVSSCYNTSMVKAGNKDINEAGGKDAGTAIAGGIVGMGSPSISGCINEGFVEALGANGTFNKLSVSQEIKGQEIEITFNEQLYETGTTNVSARSMVGGDDHDVTTVNTNKGTIFNNGAYGTAKLFEHTFTIPQAKFGNVNGINISVKEVTPIVAEVDALGGAKSIYIKIVRQLAYPGLSEPKEQIIYTDLHTFESTYETQAYSKEKGFLEDWRFVSNIRNEMIETNEHTDKGMNLVSVGGQTYGFVSSANQFLAGVNQEYAMYETEVSFNDLTFTVVEEGETKNAAVRDLLEAGYTFIAESNNSEFNINIVEIDTTNNKFKILIRGKGNESYNYAIKAVKEVPPIDVEVPVNSVFVEDGKVVVYIQGYAILAGQKFDINGKTYTAEDEDEDDKNGWQKLVYQTKAGENAEAIAEALKTLGSVTINVNKGKTDALVTEVRYIPPAQDEIIEINDVTVNGNNVEQTWSFDRNLQNLDTNLENDLVHLKNSEVRVDGTDKIYLTYNLELDGKFDNITLNGTIPPGQDWGWGGALITFATKATGTYTIGESSRTKIGELKYSVSSEGLGDIYVEAASYNSKTNKTTVNLTIDYTYQYGDTLTEEIAYEVIKPAIERLKVAYARKDLETSELKDIVAEKNGEISGIKYKHIAPKAILNFSEEVVEDTSENPIKNQKVRKYTVSYEYQNTELILSAPPATGEKIYNYVYNVNGSNDEYKIEAGGNDLKLPSPFAHEGKGLIVTRTYHVADKEREYIIDRTFIDDLDLKAWLYEDQVVLVSKDDVKVSVNNTITLDGVEYSIVRTEEGLALQNGDSEFILNDEIVTIGTSSYKVSSVENGENLVDYQFTRAYVGSEGQIKVGDKTFKYYFGGELDDKKEEVVSINGVKVKEGSDFEGYTVAFQSINKGDELNAIVEKTSDEKIKVTVSKLDSEQFYSYEKIEFEFPSESEERNVDISLTYGDKVNVTLYDEEHKDYIQSVSKNGSEYTGGGSDILVAGKESVEHVQYIVNYKTFTAENSMTIEGKNDSEETTDVKGIVLTRDIDLGSLDDGKMSKTGELDVPVSGDDHIVNFYTENTGLFTSITSEFVKDFNVAGTVYRNDIYVSGVNVVLGYVKDRKTKSLGILASDAKNLDNVKTYGSISLGRNANTAIEQVKGLLTYSYVYQNSGYTSGLVADKLSNSSNISNFASYSLFDNQYTKDAHKIDLNGISGGGSSFGGDLANYGTIIGAKGRDGAVGNNGQDGQNIYAISSSNVNSANSCTNYGIVRGGDGGRGGRGRDGKGGSDTAVSTKAPTNGTFASEAGTGAKHGQAIIALTNKKEVTIEEGKGHHDLSKTGSADNGGNGNDGWGGLNLCRYGYYWGEKKTELTHNKQDVWRGFLEASWHDAYVNGTLATTSDYVQIKYTLQVGLGAKKVMESRHEAKEYITETSEGENSYLGALIIWTRIGFTAYGAYYCSSPDIKSSDNFTWIVKYEELPWRHGNNTMSGEIKKAYINAYVTGGITDALCYSASSGDKTV